MVMVECGEGEAAENLNIPRQDIYVAVMWLIRTQSI